MRMSLEVEHPDRVESDVEELVDRLERAGDAEVVLELDGDLCKSEAASERSACRQERAYSTQEC